jgi:iron complex outermembrane receptor protein
MKTIISILLISNFPVYCCAGERRGKITASIHNNQQAAENATVELRNAKDSSLVKLAITDKTGIAEFENIRFGTYIIKVTMVNFAMQYSAPFRIICRTIISTAPAITLQPVTTQLGNCNCYRPQAFYSKII